MQFAALVKVAYHESVGAKMREDQRQPAFRMRIAHATFFDPQNAARPRRIGPRSV
jgi:hypothetical protein